VNKKFKMFDLECRSNTNKSHKNPPINLLSPEKDNFTNDNHIYIKFNKSYTKRISNIFFSILYMLKEGRGKMFSSWTLHKIKHKNS